MLYPLEAVPGAQTEHAPGVLLLYVPGGQALQPSVSEIEPSLTP
jgi:hypothetical protein